MNVPELRFRKEDGTEYPEWDEKKFGDLIVEYRELTHVENEDILLSCAIDGMYLNSELFGHHRGNSNVGYLKVYTNTLILSSQNLHLGNANVNLRFEHGIVSPAYKTYKVIGCLPLYLAIWIKRDEAKRYFYDATTVGMSECRRNIVWNVLYDQKFMLPCLEEQQKIASFLYDIDTVISLSEKEIAALEQQKKVMVQMIFSQEVRFRRDDGTIYPDWEEKRLGDVFTLTRGRVLAVRSVSLHPHDDYVYPVYSSQTKDNGLFGYYNQFLYENAITWTANGTNAGTTTYRKGKFYCTNVCGVLLDARGNANECIAEMINCASDKYVSRGGNPKLMNNTMAQISLPFPCLEEQQKIASLLSDMDAAIDLAKRELAQWKLLKKGLMQQMFL